MNERDFYDAVEFWGGLFTYGSSTAFQGLMNDLNQFGESRRAAFADYLRLMKYNRFLLTRYWRAIRLHIRALRPNCEICSMPVGDFWEVHHRGYEHHGEEHAHLNDLLLVCSIHHKAIHEGELLVLSRMNRGVPTKEDAE